MMAEDDFVLKTYLENLYSNKSGYVRYAEGEREKYAEEGVHVTYAEMLYEGWKELIDLIEVGPDDVFYDLGSGVGKSCMQWFLEQPVKKVCGIEAMKVRHDIAAESLEQAKKDLPTRFSEGREIEFIHDNIFNCDLSDATIVYVCATCFPTDVMERLGKVLSGLPKLKYIFSFKSIPSWPETKEITLTCTWGDGTCRLYSMNT